MNDLRTAGPVCKLQGGDSLSCTISSQLTRQKNADKITNATRTLGLAWIQNYRPSIPSSGSISYLPKSLSCFHTLQTRSLCRPFGFGSSIIHLNSIHLSSGPAVSQNSQPPAARDFSSGRDQDVTEIIELAKRAQKSGNSVSALFRSGVSGQELTDIRES